MHSNGHSEPGREFGEIVRAQRRRLLLTQEELAKQTGVSVRSIQKLEAGRIATPRPVTIRLLADAFQLTGTDRESFCHAADGMDRRPTAATTAPPMVVPRQLPAPPHIFTGRADQLAHLDELFAAAADQPTTVVISAIAGTAGVGKTALAVHWAHRVSGRFPDGQLYINLRGFDREQPTAPTDALTSFLTALGVASQDIPLEVDDRAGRYRSEVAGRRMLIVLDNASTVEQVRPLLPGTGTCAVVVTSRNRLAGLAALHGAHRLDLDLLPLPDAVRLLRRLIGSRVDTEPAAAATLADQCSRLPLALRVAAELAASRPTAPLAELVTELDGLQSRLELLNPGDDPHATVKIVFSWSIRHLPPDGARTFRLLGLHPGPDFDRYATAALTGTGLEPARRTLDQLTRANLIHATGRERYGMHDLLRAYAVHLTAVEQTGPDRREAWGRLFDYYLATAAAAMDSWYPAETHRRPPIPPPTTPTPVLTDPDAAKTWLDAERPCLVASAALAADHGRRTYPALLSTILYRYLESCHYLDGMTIYHNAYETAEQANDLAGQAAALRGLGAMSVQTGTYEPAAGYLTRALALYRKVGDQTGEATAVANLGVIEERLGRFTSAAQHHQQAIAGFRRAGDEIGEANALTNLGVCEDLLGRYELAIDRHRRALALYRKLGSPQGEICALNNLGAVEIKLCRYGESADHHRYALDLSRRLRQPHSEAAALDSIGILHIRLGQPEQANTFFAQALTLYCEIRNRDGEAWARNGLGEAAHAAGRAPDALTHHAAALAIANEIGIRDQQARAHAGLGDAQLAIGELTTARTHYEQAVAGYRELGMPDADEVRARLNACDEAADAQA
jgi:tetratricopeptide (TPR) repeat protein/transcriptional regulator with XRE-family HTH domain